MTQTRNLKLNKPDKTDFIDIAKLNENMDILDEVTGRVATITNTKEVIVTLPSGNWSSSAPYSQKVSVPTAKATDSVTMGKAYTKDNTLEEIETWDEMAGLITSAEVSDGYVTFYSKSEKPSRTFKVKLKGVK